MIITVTPVNDPPIVDNDANTITEDGTPATGDLTDAGDFDIDGTTLVVNTTPLSGPTNGVITINSNGTYSYTPNPNFNGKDTIIVEVCDQGLPLPALCTVDTLIISVTACLDNPNADCDGDGVINSIEVLDGTNPSDPCEYLVLSQTVAVSQSWEQLDCDNDGITNGVEVMNGSNPFNPCDPYPTLASCSTGVKVPEAFTPDNDNVNDYFVIKGLEEYPTNSLIVFNRWGSEVYKTDNYENNWDGKSNSTLIIGEDKLPSGVYYFILDLKTTGMEPIKGFVYIKR